MVLASLEEGTNHGLVQEGKKLLLLRTFVVRHSGAGQPSVRSRKLIVAKGKKKRTVLVIAVIGGRIEDLRTH